MYRFAQAAKAGVNAANTVHWQLRASSANRLFLVEFGIFVSTASTTALTWVVSRSSALGTSTTTVAGTPVDPNNTTAAGTVDSAWSAAPTFTTAGPHQFTFALPLTAGAGFVWVAPNDRGRILISASAGLCIAASASGSTVGANTFYACWEE